MLFSQLKKVKIKFHHFWPSLWKNIFVYRWKNQFWAFAGKKSFRRPWVMVLVSSQLAKCFDECFPQESVSQPFWFVTPFVTPFGISTQPAISVATRVGLVQCFLSLFWVSKRHPKMLQLHPKFWKPRCGFVCLEVKRFEENIASYTWLLQQTAAVLFADKIFWCRIWKRKW